MAPSRRPRRDESSDSDTTDDEVTSTANETQRKRARLSGNRRSDEDSDSASDPDESASEAAAPASNLPASTQYEIDRDAGFKHLRNERKFDEVAQMRIQNRSKTIGDNRPADNSIIESITMINFMNHEKCHLELGPLINFIVGENGSGKSAALTALIICLGGRASATNRGGSLKAFIKEGRELCQLSVKIKNQGTDAYKPDVFGESIIIERSFSRSGASTFKLKSAQGRIISTKKADIADVMEYYQMQVDNPMTILSQDNAKQFLNKATPAMKYGMFMKGVQLEQLDNDYRLVAETADAMAEKLEEKEEHVKRLAANLKKAKAAAEIVAKNKNMREKEKSLVRLMAWGQVEVEEQELKKCQGVLEEYDREIAAAERVVRDKDDEFQAVNASLERAQAAVAELGQQMDPLKEEEETCKAAFEQAKQEHFNIHAEQKQIGQSLQTSKAAVQKLEDAIQEELNRIENANGGAHAQKLQQLAEAQDRVIEAKKHLAEMPDDSELQRQLARAKDDLNKALRPIEEKRHEVDTCRSKIRTMSQDANQHRNAFDPKVWRLKRMVDEFSGWRDKPLGPLGMHIKLLNPIWSNIIEKAIGGNLNAFLVSSKADQTRLQSMMRQIGLNCNILIGSNRPIDYRSHEPDDRFDTILRVLEFDNEVIKSQMIIAHAIEQSILIQDRREAHHTMYEGPQPRNVKQCFCINEARRGWGLRFAYSGGGGAREQGSTPMEPPNGPPRMKTDMDSQITYLKESLTILEREQNALENSRRDLQQNVQRKEHAIRQYQRSKREAELQLQKAEEAVERIQEQLDQDNVEDGRLEALRLDLVEAQGQVSTDTGSYQQAALQKDKQNAIATSHKNALKAARDLVAEHEAKIAKADQKIRRIMSARQIVLQDKNTSIDRLEHLRAKIARARQNVEAQQATVIEFSGEASKICADRVYLPDGVTYQDVETQYTDLAKALKKQRERQGKSDEQVNEEYEKANETYETAKKQKDGLIELLNLLKQSYVKRLDKWREFQCHISAAARMQFTYLLSERGFRGKLMLDHKQKELTLTVEPDETKRHDKGRATSTLSGGEKSFSNVCLLMSVWDAMGSPLRCLDEFDVYMDSVNRDVTSKLIIGAARRSVGKQFIIISPLAIGGNVERDADVRIHRMKDPRQPQIADAITH